MRRLYKQDNGETQKESDGGVMLPETEPCAHDYDHPIRKGRAHYTCPKCGEDITMELCFVNEAEEREEMDCGSDE